MASSGKWLASVRITAGLTLLSRIAGLAREVIFGYFFSTSELLSAFRIAFLIPNLARRLFGEGALSAAVVPVLSKQLHDQGEDAGRKLVGSLLGILLVVLVGLTLVAEVGLMVARYFTDDPAIRLTVMTLPYMPLICAAALLGGVLNVRGRFAVPAAAPILFNILVAGATFAAAIGLKYSEAALMNVLCWSVVAGGVAQLLLVQFALVRDGFSYRLGFQWRMTEVREVVKMMVPMFVGLSAVQFNTLADSIIAYHFVVVDGERIGPAVLGYAQFLYQLPLGVLGIALATAVFPALSAKASAGDHNGLIAILGGGVRLSLFLALPASVGLMFAARPLVATLYQHGSFSARDTDRVAAALICYSVGLVAYFAQHVVVRAFYALRDSKTPARIALYMVGLNVVGNLLLVTWLEEKGLALSTAMCAIVQIVWLAGRFQKLVPGVRWNEILGSAPRMIAATTVMCMVLAILTWGPLSAGSIHVGLRLAVLVISGIVSFGLAAKLLGIGEMDLVLGKRTST
ncbi:MAG: murein biosynthesis integral membrane protein MurJ [Planctomycetota bacterium]